MPHVGGSGEGPCQGGRQRGDAVEGAGLVGRPEQREHGDGDVQAEPFGGDPDPVEVEIRGVHQQVAQPCQRQGAPRLLDGAVRIVRDRGAVAQGGPLRALDGARGLVERLPLREDLGDRAGDLQDAGPGLLPGQQLDGALEGGDRVGAVLPLLEMLDECFQQGEETFRGDIHRPGGDREVEISAGGVGEIPGGLQHSEEPRGGHDSLAHSLERPREEVHGLVGVAQLPARGAAGDPEGEAGTEGADLVELGDLLVLALVLVELGEGAVLLGEAAGGALLCIPDPLRGGAELGFVDALASPGQAVAGEPLPRGDAAQAAGKGVEERRLGSPFGDVVGVLALGRGRAAGRCAHRRPPPVRCAGRPGRSGRRGLLRAFLYFMDGSIVSRGRREFCG
nr:hypothetical protein [Brachybacterium faecium]